MLLVLESYPRVNVHGTWIEYTDTLPESIGLRSRAKSWPGSCDEDSVETCCVVPRMPRVMKIDRSLQLLHDVTQRFSALVTMLRSA